MDTDKRINIILSRVGNAAKEKMRSVEKTLTKNMLSEGIRPNFHLPLLTKAQVANEIQDSALDIIIIAVLGDLGNEKISEGCYQKNCPSYCKDAENNCISPNKECKYS